MARLVCHGARVVCSGSLAGTPVSYATLPISGVAAEEAPGATNDDRLPLVNIPSFGICKLGGSLCFPALSAQMSGAPTVLIAGVPVLTEDSRFACARGGVVSFRSAGQSSVEVC